MWTSSAHVRQSHRRGRARQVAVVDVRVAPGYTPAMTAADVECREESVMAVTRLDSTTTLHRAPRAKPLLVVDDISKQFETPDGVLIAVDHVSFDVRAGRIPRR